MRSQIESESICMHLNEATLCFSASRLAPYLAAADGDEQTALDLYIYNIEVSAAFWVGFSLLEVTLRNRVHDALTHRFGTERWWEKTPLTGRESNSIAVAEQRCARYGEPGVGQIISEIGFGFWVGLLSTRHHAGMWLAGLERIFSPTAPRRADVHAALQRLQRLRNRIAHHEPVYSRDLVNDHVLLLTALNWLSPETSRWAAEHSRVSAIIRTSRRPRKPPLAR
ncbi:hypothetical protein [Subtercola vilae]|nr:hypothetical protein [Subtercola vilae]